MVWLAQKFKLIRQGLSLYKISFIAIPFSDGAIRLQKFLNQGISQVDVQDRRGRKT